MLYDLSLIVFLKITMLKLYLILLLLINYAFGMEEFLKTIEESDNEISQITNQEILSLKELCVKKIASFIINPAEFPRFTIDLEKLPQDLLEEIESSLYKYHTNITSDAIKDCISSRRLLLKEEVTAVAIDLNNKFIVIGNMSGKVKVYEIESQEHLYNLDGHKKCICYITLSSDSTFIVTASWDKSVRIWQSDSGRCINVKEDVSPIIRFIVISSDKNFIIIVTWDGSMRIWNLQRDLCLCILEDCKGQLAISSDSKYLAYSASKYSLNIYNIESANQISILNAHQATISSILITGDNKSIISSSYDTMVKKWNASSGKCEREIKGHCNIINVTSLSPDDNILITGSSDKTIKIWNLNSKKDKDNKCFRNLVGHTDIITSIAISPDKKLIATGSYDRAIKIWHIMSGNCLFTIDDHNDWVRFLTITLSNNRNGMVIVADCFPSEVKIWQIYFPKLGDLIKKIRWNQDKLKQKIKKKNQKREKTKKSKRKRKIPIKFYKSTQNCCTNT